MEARGAIARRNRTLKIYGVVLLAGALGLAGYCALRPGFDLSTPKRALKTFQRAMDDRRWSVAERCLTDGCRAHYAPFIADRRLFDFYSPYGYQSEYGRFVPDWRVKSVEQQGDTAQARLSSGLPYIGAEGVGFRLYLVRGPDGLWRVDGPREDCAAWYERLIPQEARGWAAAEEKK